MTTTAITIAITLPLHEEDPTYGPAVLDNALHRAARQPAPGADLITELIPQTTTEFTATRQRRIRLTIETIPAATTEHDSSRR